MNGEEMWNAAIAEVEETIKIKKQLELIQPTLNKIKNTIFDNDLDVAAFMYLTLSNEYNKLLEKHSKSI